MSDPRLCELCPKLCRYACPIAAATADEGATPTAMLQAAAHARAGTLAPEAAVELLERCDGCGACLGPCEFDQDVPQLLRAARRELAGAGHMAPAAAALQDALRRTGSPFAVDGAQLLREHAAPQDFDPKGRVLYWPGCRALAGWPDRVPRELALLRALGAEHISLPARDDTPCCGEPLRVIGDDPGYQVAAASLQQYFNRQRTWVTPCSSCLRSVQEGYPSIGIEVRAETLHVSEYLLFFRKQLTERAADPGGPVYVHDAPGLVRGARGGEEVYEVIEAATGRRPLPLYPGPRRPRSLGAGDFHDLRRPAAAALVAEHTARSWDLPPDAWVVTGDSGDREALQRALPGRRTDDLVGFLLQLL